MLRGVAFRALRAVPSSFVLRPVTSCRSLVAKSPLPSLQATPSYYIPALRFYSAPAGLQKQEVQGRIMDLLKNFDKVTDATKISATSNFANDLGLDSLDTVEVVMAIEEEFSIEIPDKDADSMHSIDQAVDYICAQPDAH